MYIFRYLYIWPISILRFTTPTSIILNLVLQFLPQWCRLDIVYGLTPLYKGYIVNTSIPNKPRLRMSFDWTMTKYAFTSPPKNWGGRANWHTNRYQGRQEKYHDKTKRKTSGNREHTSNWIEINSDKNKIRVMTGKLIW